MIDNKKLEHISISQKKFTQLDIFSKNSSIDEQIVSYYFQFFKMFMLNKPVKHLNMEPHIFVRVFYDTKSNLAIVRIERKTS